MKPLCVDLFCGLGGWSEGFLDYGYECVGFDIERHSYGDQRYPGQLVLQDVLTLHGSQFQDAAIILASPPCQNYSYLAMPWSRSKSEHSQAAKALRRKWETEGPDNRLFNACFRIQREATLARAQMLGCCIAGNGLLPRDVLEPCSRCFIPLIVENVRGAQPWVGRSRWHHGSFHLWGDVPALMPINLTRRMKSRIDCSPRRFDERIATTPEEAHALHYKLPADDGIKGTKPVPHRGWTAGVAISLGLENYNGQKVPVYSDPRRNGGKGVHLTSPQENGEGLKIGGDGTKQSAGHGDWFSKDARDGGAMAKFSSRSSARKAASALIARIPAILSEHIAQVYWPRNLL